MATLRGNLAALEAEWGSPRQPCGPQLPGLLQGSLSTDHQHLPPGDAGRGPGPCASLAVFRRRDPLKVHTEEIQVYFAPLTLQASARILQPFPQQPLT